MEKEAEGGFRGKETRNKKGEKCSILIGRPSTQSEIEETIKLGSKLLGEEEVGAAFFKEKWEDHVEWVSASIESSILINGCYIAKEASSPHRVIAFVFAIDWTGKFSAQWLEERYMSDVQAGSIPSIADIWINYSLIFHSPHNNYSEQTKILRIQGVGVVEEYRGFKLATILGEEVVKEGRRSGFEVAVYEASGIFSEQVARGIGFEIECSLEYESYKYRDKDGIEKQPYVGINQFITQRIKERTGKDVLDPASRMTLLDMKLVTQDP